MVQESTQTKQVDCKIEKKGLGVYTLGMAFGPGCITMVTEIYSPQPSRKPDWRQRRSGIGKCLEKMHKA